MSTAADASTFRVDPATAVVLVAAGDIACPPGLCRSVDQCRQDETAALVEALAPDVVAPLGDLQYERGEAANFDAAYLRTWGRLLDRTHAAPGNHEYAGGKAAGYYSRLGGAAGSNPKLGGIRRRCLRQVRAMRIVEVERP